MVRTVNIGDVICVIMFPALDVFGNDYEILSGGAGTVLEVKEDSVIVKLFDGNIIEADGTEFEIIDDFELIEELKATAIVSRT